MENKPEEGKIYALTGAIDMLDGTLHTPASYDPDTFPKYEHLIPTETPLIEITLNADYLEGICNVLKRVNDFEQVTLSIYSGHRKPIKLTAENKDTGQKARALLMPIMK